jgi:hypothetical protein
MRRWLFFIGLLAGGCSVGVHSAAQNNTEPLEAGCDRKWKLGFIFARSDPGGIGFAARGTRSQPARASAALKYSPGNRENQRSHQLLGQSD